MKNKAEVEKYTKELKAKSKECESLYGQIEIFNKDVKTLKNQMDNDTNYELVRDLRSKLEIKEKQCQDLQTEVKFMERIQKQQGVQLEKLSDQTDYTKKIRSMGEENRAQAERICKLTLIADLLVYITSI